MRNLCRSISRRRSRGGAHTALLAVVVACIAFPNFAAADVGRPPVTFSVPTDPGPHPKLMVQDYANYRKPGTAEITGSIPLVMPEGQNCFSRLELYPSTPYTEWVIKLASFQVNEKFSEDGDDYLPGGSPQPKFLRVNTTRKNDSAVRLTYCDDDSARFAFHAVPACVYDLIVAVHYEREYVLAEDPTPIWEIGDGYLLKSDPIAVEDGKTYALNPPMTAVARLVPAQSDL